MFTKTFFHFFFSFVAILALAFGVLLYAGNLEEANPVDNVAVPQ